MRFGKTMAAVTAGMVLAWTSPMWAQATQPGATGMQHPMQMQGMPGHMQGKLILDKASDIIGKEVVDQKGEKLGEIKELAVDGHTGQIAYAVLEAKSSDKLYAIPWNALKPKIEAGKEEQGHLEKIQQFTLDITKQKLDSAPGFNKDHWPDMANPEFEKNVHEFYGQKPWHQRGQMMHPQGGKTGTEGGAGQTEAQPGQTGAQPGQQAPGQQAAAEKGPRQILKAKAQLIDQKVTDQSGKDVGKVENLLVDCQHGTIALAVTKFDNFGKKDLAALPWKTIDWKWNAEKKEGWLALNVPIDQVRKEKLFESGAWPDFANRQEVASIYRNFNLQPYWEGRQPGEVYGFEE